MGSRLACIAAQLLCLVAVAHADKGKDRAAELMKKGIVAYKAGNFDEAIAAIAEAYELDPKPDTLFTLAQAERLGGHCDAAIPHYKQLVAGSSDLNIAKLVEASLALCPQPASVEPPRPIPHEAPPVVVAPPPKPITITRDVRHTDGLAVGSIVVGGLALGAGVALVVASSSLATSANHARTLDDYNTLHDRADRDRTLGLVAGGVGVALVGFAIFRFVQGGEPEPRTEIAVAPASGGGTLVVTGRW